MVHSLKMAGILGFGSETEAKENPDERPGIFREGYYEMK